MSSRVQKGSIVFRPVAKGRGRPTSGTPVSEHGSSAGPGPVSHGSAQLGTPHPSVSAPPTQPAQIASAPRALAFTEEEAADVTPAQLRPISPTIRPTPPAGPSKETPEIPPTIDQVYLPPTSTPDSSPTCTPAIPSAVTTPRTPSMVTNSSMPQANARKLTLSQPVFPALSAATVPSSTVPSSRPQASHGDMTGVSPTVPAATSPSPQLQDGPLHHSFFQPDTHNPFHPYPEHIAPPQAAPHDSSLPYAPLTPLQTQSGLPPYAPAPFYPHLAFGPANLGSPHPVEPGTTPMAEASTHQAPKTRKRKGKETARGAATVVDEGGGVEVSKKRRGRTSGPKNIQLGEASADETGVVPAERQRRARLAVTLGTEGSLSTSPARERKRRTSSSASAVKRKRGKRVPTPPPLDGTAEGEELDPTATTMADLCEDVGTGRVSSKAQQIVANHAVWKATGREKREQLKARMEARKYGREEEDGGAGTKQAQHGAQEQKQAQEQERGERREYPPETPTTGLSAAPSGSIEGGVVADEDEAQNAALENRDGFDYSRTVQTSKYNVQVRIGPNGETIIDEQSLFVERPDEEAETEEYTHIEESDATKFVNSMSYSKKPRGSRWSAAETEMFFDALSQFGENYELISLVLPGRDRKACKNKFKAEDKRDPARVTYCLKNCTPYDINTLARLTGKDFSGPTPVIKARTPPALVDKEPRRDEQTATKKSGSEPPAKAKRKKGRTPAVPSDGEEILGVADSFIDDDDP